MIRPALSRAFTCQIKAIQSLCLNLKRGVRFAHGREVEAEEYVFSFERILDPTPLTHESAEPIMGRLFKGMEKMFFAKKSQTPKIASETVAWLPGGLEQEHALKIPNQDLADRAALGAGGGKRTRPDFSRRLTQILAELRQRLPLRSRQSVRRQNSSSNS